MPGQHGEDGGCEPALVPELAGHAHGQAPRFGFPDERGEEAVEARRVGAGPGRELD